MPGVVVHSGLIEPASWPCVGAQVKDGSHVVISTACKITHSQYETSCGFRPLPRKGIASSSISILSIVPDYQYQYSVMYTSAHTLYDSRGSKCAPSGFHLHVLLHIDNYGFAPYYSTNKNTVIF